MASPPPSPRPPTPPSPPPPPEPTQSGSVRRNPVRFTRAATLTPIQRGRSMARAPPQSPPPPPPQTRPCEEPDSSTAARRYPLRKSRTVSTPRQSSRTLELPPPPPSVPPTRPPPSSLGSRLDAAQGLGEIPNPRPPPSSLGSRLDAAQGLGEIPNPRPPPPSLGSRLDAAKDIGSTAAVEDAKVIKIPLEGLHHVLDLLGVSDVERSAKINDVSKSCLAVYNRALDSENKLCSTMIKAICQMEANCNDLCSVLGEEYELSDEQKLSESLANLHGFLRTAVLRLEKLKEERLKNLQALQLKMIDFWDRLGVTLEEQKDCHYMMLNASASLDEVTAKDALSAALLSKIHSEVKRLENLFMQEIKKKFAVLAGNLCQTHLSCHEDYELKFSLIDVHEGKIDKFSADEKLDELIVKSKKDILRRAEIVDRAEILLNKRKGSKTCNQAAVTSLIKRIGDWEVEHNDKFIYDGRDLVRILIEPETECHHLTDATPPLAAGKGQSPTVLESWSEKSDDSESDDDSDYMPSESEE